MFLGALSYADDIVLLCPTVTAVKIMLDKCEKFSNDYNILFNASKSKIIVHTPRNTVINLTPIKLSGNDIPIVKALKHVGITVGSESNIDDTRITEACNMLYAKLNILLRQTKYALSTIKYKLFNVYCTSFYGGALYNYSSDECMKRIEIAWRNCLRRIFNLPYNCHRNLFTYICNDCNIGVKLHKRFIKFILSLLRSNNVCINMVTKLMMNGSQSCTSRSLNHISHKYKLPRDDLCIKCLSLISESSCTEDAITGAAISDFIYYRDSHPNDNDTQLIIDHLCTL